MDPRFDKIRTSGIEKLAVRIIDSIGKENPTRYSNKREYSNFALKLVQTIKRDKNTGDFHNSLKISYGFPFFRKTVFEKEENSVNKFERGIWEHLLEEVYEKKTIELI